MREDALKQCEKAALVYLFGSQSHTTTGTESQIRNDVLLTSIFNLYTKSMVLAGNLKYYIWTMMYQHLFVNKYSKTQRSRKNKYLHDMIKKYKSRCLLLNYLKIIIQTNIYSVWNQIYTKNNDHNPWISPSGDRENMI